MSKELFITFDIGASSGVKVAVFNNETMPVSEPFVCANEYNESFDVFAGQLYQGAQQALKSIGKSVKDVSGIGIATAGILSHDGGFQLFHNRPQYNGHNLKLWMEKEFDLPAKIANDADAGGLAEWSVLKLELLYWVFGGGWGGSWINADGEVMFPTYDWDGRDDSLHYSNEPGYSIGLEIWKLKTLFREVGASFELFERQLVSDPLLPGDSLTGPSGNTETLRAEVFLSGPGRVRIFRAVVGNDDFYEQFLEIDEINELSDPSVAGAHISKLSRMRVESAINTDRLYGKILAEAARMLLKQAQRDGLPGGAPICLGGKPSYALPYFGPSTQRVLGKMGFLNYMRPSVIDERGSNANLVGAAELARRAFLENS